MCVYNDAGDEMALKVFEADEDHDTMELGTLREVSILRILRGENAHPNIVQLIDIQGRRGRRLWKWKFVYGHAIVPNGRSQGSGKTGYYRIRIGRTKATRGYCPWTNLGGGIFA